MSRLLLEKPFPGATTCVLVGDALALDRTRLQPFRHLLWLTDRDNVQRARPILPRHAIQTAFVDDSPAQPAVEQFLRRDPRHLPSVFVSDTVLTQHSDAYRRALAELHATLESHHRSRVTRQKDGFAWQKNVLENLTDYATRRIPAAWAGALRGIPAFVCGGSPSLEVSAPKLAPHATHGVVFATDSSLRTLAQHDIPVDFAVFIDAAKHPDKYLPLASSPARLVLSPVSPPSWQAALPRADRLYLSNSQITVDWLATQSIPRPPLAVAENGRATALELARFLGCAPIYLFGLDLASDAGASMYRESGDGPALDMPHVPGNHAKAVPTLAYGELRALNERLAAWPAGLVINVNDRGARLRNTTVVHPDAFTLAPAGAKASRLAALTPIAPLAPAVLHAARNRVRLAATLGRTKAAEIRRTLEHRTPEAAAVALRQLFSDQTFAHVFGDYSLKLMPHLVPPIEPDPAPWHALLDELDELCALASR